MKTQNEVNQTTDTEAQERARRELGNIETGDIRRNNRLALCLQSMIESPGKSVPEFTSDWASCKAVYRMLESRQITHDLKGQGAIGRTDSMTGFHLHNTAIMGAYSGVFYGLLGAKLYARDLKKRRNAPKGTRNRERIEEKESYR